MTSTRCPSIIFSNLFKGSSSLQLKCTQLFPFHPNTQCVMPLSAIKPHLRCSSQSSRQPHSEMKKARVYLVSLNEILPQRSLDLYPGRKSLNLSELVSLLVQ